MIGIAPAKKPTKSGSLALSPGEPIPRAMPTTGMIAKRKTRATRPNSRFMASPRPGRRSLGLEQSRDPGRAQARRDDPGDPEQDDDRLRDVLPAHRTQENGLAGQVGARRVELFADQGVIARRDEKRKLGRVRLAGNLDRPGRLPRLRQDQRLREEITDEKNRGRPLADHPRRDSSGERELIV